MPRDRVLPMLEGDRVEDGRGNVGSVRRCLNVSTREYFLSVKVVDGPDKGQWGKSYQFRPVLDIEGGTIRVACDGCDRPFLSRARVLGDLGGYTVPRDTRCVSCSPRATAQLPDQDVEGYVGSQEHATEHHAK